MHICTVYSEMFFFFFGILALFTKPQHLLKGKKVFFKLFFFWEMHKALLNLGP